MSAEPREFEMRTRERRGLRADREWVEWVAEHGNDGGMLLNIPLTDVEFEELRVRRERATAALRAFSGAAPSSEAGAWIDQLASGVVRLLLAHPSAAERAAAEEIVAAYGGSVELVEHSTRELEQVLALVRAEKDVGSAFGRAAVSWSVDVWANAVSVSLRGDRPPPPVPESLGAAVRTRQLLLFWPARLSGWGPSTQHDMPDAGAAAAALDAARATSGSADDEFVPVWLGIDRDDWWEHWQRCARYVAERSVGGLLEPAWHLAEAVGLSVRFVEADEGHGQAARSGRVTILLDPERRIREVLAE